MVTIAPYGTWASPISAADLAAGAIRIADLRTDGGRLFWLESRPAEGGRQVVMRADADGANLAELTPEGFNVRTRVHEYGGAAYAARGETVWFANFVGQRLHAQTLGAAPVPLTPEGYRYADFVARPAGAPAGGLLGVREDHTDPANVKNQVVALSGQAGDAGTVLFGDSDFVAYPRLSADGARLAWIAWDHPNMPWDDTVLRIADLGPGGLANIRIVAGEKGESVLEPQWGEDGALFFISDRSGFWNLYVDRGGETAALLPKDAEFAHPLWSLGQANYALMGGGRVAARCAGLDGALLVIEPGGGEKTIPLPFTQLGALHRLDARRVAMVAASGDQTAAVITVDIETGAWTLVRRPSPAALEARHVAHAQAIEFATTGGLAAHAFYYPPTNADFAAPAGEAPPLIVGVHGGPTAQSSPAFDLETQFWTSRGFAVVDVNYRGSTGYGRAYRQRLNGAWGVVDVEDAIAAVRHLVERGLADPKRVAIHGGSAGGFTTLACLALSDVFSAGASYFGVADIAALARDTHKFESRYMDTMVGPYPKAKALYDERSPLSHLDGFAAPLILFQGADDPIVPPNQAHMILEALRSRQQPVAYLEFAGESHGFRRKETLIACHEAELTFYGRVFGFTPAGPLPSLRIENLPGP